MKLAFIYCGIFLRLIDASFAGEPPEPMAAEARLRTATHVFVARAVSARIVDENRKPRGEHPPWLVAGRGEAFEITLTKITPLFPASWHPPKSIVIFSNSGGFVSEATARPMIGHDQIYFVRKNSERNRFDDFCINSTEDIKHLEDVQKQIDSLKK